MRDDAAPGPLTPASAPQAPARLGREDPRNSGSGTLMEEHVSLAKDDQAHVDAHDARDLQHQLKEVVPEDR